MLATMQIFLQEVIAETRLQDRTNASLNELVTEDAANAAGRLHCAN